MSEFLNQFDKGEQVQESRMTMGVSHEVKQDKKHNKRTLLRAIIIASSLLIVSAVVIVIYHFSTLVEVPNFIGRPASEASTWALANRVSLSLDEEYSIYTEEGHVMFQSVYEGSSIRRGSALALLISAGPNMNELVTLPDFSSMSIREVRDWRVNQQVLSISIMEEYHDSIEAGRLIRKEFASPTVNAANFTRSDGLLLFMSRGEEDPERVARIPVVPDFSDYLRDQVGSYAGLTVHIVEHFDMEIPYGRLVSQSMEPGVRITQDNNELTLIFSLGRPYIEDLRGQLENSIAPYFYQFTLGGTDITYSIRHVWAEEPRGTIVRVSHVNQWLEMDTHVEIRVSNRRPQ